MWVFFLINSDRDGLEWKGAERERAAACYLSCKHLPLSLFAFSDERKMILDGAIAMMERIGDKKKLDECAQLRQTLS